MPQTKTASDLVPLDEDTWQFLREHTLPKNGKSQAWFRVENSDTKKKTPAKVYIYAQIGASFWDDDGVTSKAFIKELNDIEEDQFDLHINSPGGAIFEGVAIYNAIKQHPAFVTVYVDALAASAASFVSQAGDKIVIARNAEMMIHDGQGICFGNADDMLRTYDILNRLSNNIADIYAQRAGLGVNYWRALMKEETWFNGTEAVNSGLADEVFEPKPQEKSDPEEQFNLAFFNYSGRSHAPAPSKVKKMVLANLAEEASVQPKNSDSDENESGDGGQVPTSPAQPEKDPVTRPEEAVPVEDDEPEKTGGTEDAPSNRLLSGTFYIDGVATVDAGRIQQHINSLETSQKEQQQANRKNFVKNLSDNKKIMASQVTAMEEFALELSDKAYQKWVATWDVAAPLAALSSVVGGITNPAPQNTVADDELDIAAGVVKQNMLVNMSQEQLEKTPSYLKLKAANALDKIGRAS